MGRRGENIRKRKDGRWEARIICGYDLKGKAKYRSLYGKTYLEVKSKRNQMIQNDFASVSGEDGKDGSKKRVTFEQVMREWLASKKGFVKESTFVHYTLILEKHIFPDLGGYCFSALTSEIINDFLRKKLNCGRLDGKGGLSSKTVTDIRSVLLLGLEFARQNEYPCVVNTKVFCPKNRQPSIKVMTREEQCRLEKYLFSHPEPLELGILTALYGGLRIGEVCALCWGDFQFENGTLQVNKTMLRIQNLNTNEPQKTKILIDCPKTMNSCRLIPLPSFILDFLARHKCDNSAYILTGNITYMEPRVCLSKYKQILKQAGLKSFTFHTLRHTFATRCVEMGFDTKSLSEILGHANVNTTLQRYVHPSMEIKKEQMEKLEKISICGQKKGQKTNENVESTGILM